MDETTKLILKQTQEAINRAVEDARKRRNEEDRKFIVSQIGKDLADILKPLMVEIAKNSKLNKEEFRRIVDELKIEKIEIKSPDVKVTVPEIKLPEIKIPQIVVPKSEITVNPKINFPKEMEVKGIAGYFKTLVQAFTGKLNVGLEEIDRDNPLTVTLVDKNGAYYTALGGAGAVIAGGRGGGIDPVGLKVGDGTETVVTSGVSVQLPDIGCKRVFIVAHESNTGTIVVGGSTVSAALTGRRGRSLFASQGDWFNVANLNLLYLDSTEDGDKITYYYEI